MCANINVFIYFMISYGKYIAILYHYLTFSVNTRVRSPSVGLGLGIEGFVPFGEVAEAGSQWNKRRDRRRAQGPQRGQAQGPQEERLLWDRSEGHGC